MAKSNSDRAGKFMAQRGETVHRTRHSTKSVSNERVVRRKPLLKKMSNRKKKNKRQIRRVKHSSNVGKDSLD